MSRQLMLQRTRQVLLMTGISVIAFLPACTADTDEVTANVPQRPRLVLQITVDQFRGDLPTRYADRLGEGGLRYLLEEGIHYNNAHHAHANTETIVGHVTLATGAHPAAHGEILRYLSFADTGESYIECVPQTVPPGLPRDIRSRVSVRT